MQLFSASLSYGAFVIGFYALYSDVLTYLITYPVTHSYMEPSAIFGQIKIG